MWKNLPFAGGKSFNFAIIGQLWECVLMRDTTLALWSTAGATGFCYVHSFKMLLKLSLAD